MENENESIPEAEQVTNSEEQEEAEETEESEQGENTEPKQESKEKNQESPDDKRVRLERELARHNRKHPPTRETPKQESKSDKSSDLDYGKLAFYNSKSDSIKIESEADVDFLKSQMQETGKSQDNILNSKWFQAELKERQEIRTSEKATPKGTKRSGQSVKDSVDYHLERYQNGQTRLSELPFEMRKQVLEKAMKNHQEKGKFVFQK